MVEVSEHAEWVDMTEPLNTDREISVFAAEGIIPCEGGHDCRQPGLWIVSERGGDDGEHWTLCSGCALSHFSSWLIEVRDEARNAT